MQAGRAWRLWFVGSLGVWAMMGGAFCGTENPAGPGSAPDSPTSGCSLESLGTLPSRGVVSRQGTLARDCPHPDEDGAYARYYVFEVRQTVGMRIGMSSSRSLSGFLRLRQGRGFSGSVVAYDANNMGPEIRTRVEAGTYTIEVTTLFDRITGSFTLTVETTP